MTKRYSQLRLHLMFLFSLNYATNALEQINREPLLEAMEKFGGSIFGTGNFIL